MRPALSQHESRPTLGVAGELRGTRRTLVPRQQEAIAHPGHGIVGQRAPVLDAIALAELPGRVCEVMDEVAVGRQHEQPRRLPVEPPGDLERAPAEPLFKQVEDERRLPLVVAAGVARRFVEQEVGPQHGRVDDLPFQGHTFVANPAARVLADLAVDLDDAAADQRPRLLARGQAGPGEVSV